MSSSPTGLLPVTDQRTQLQARLCKSDLAAFDAERRRHRSLNLAGGRRRGGRSWWSADPRWRCPLPTTGWSNGYAAVGNTQGVQGCCEDAHEVLLSQYSSVFETTPLSNWSSTQEFYSTCSLNCLWCLFGLQVEYEKGNYIVSFCWCQCTYSTLLLLLMAPVSDWQYIVHHHQCRKAMMNRRSDTAFTILLKSIQSQCWFGWSAPGILWLSKIMYWNLVMR